MRILLAVALTSCAPPPDARDTTCPPPGALVITELAIRGSSYIELYNGSSQTLDLSTLTISVTGSGAPRNVDTSASIAPNRYQAVPVATLADAGGAVAIACDGGTIDEARYGPTKGDVWALDGSKPPDALLNDLSDSWCDQLGSAGGPNLPCGAAACEGASRPRSGDLLVNEVMRDPEGADAEGEWIELYVAADDPVTLNGLEVEEVATSTRKFALVAPPCATVEPRALVVLPLGGDADVRLVRGSGLFNDAAKLTLRLDGVVIDEVDVACGRAGSSCAWVDDAWCETSEPTPGEDNSCAP